MKLGQLVAAIGALLALIGGAVFPLYEMIYEGKSAMLMELQLGLGILALCVAILAVAGYGFWFRKLKRAALINLVLSGTALGLLVFVSMRAPALFREIHDMPFDEAGQFTGFMDGGVGLYCAWFGLLAGFFGSLKTIGSQSFFHPDTRFLRLTLHWSDSLIKEMTLAEGEGVTVGSGLRNTFVLPTSFARLLLFKFKGGRRDHYWVGLTEQLDGKVTIDGKTETPREFRKKFTSESSGVNYVAIKPGDSGIFKFGEQTLTFQFVKPAISTFQSRLKEVDTGLASTFLLSFAIQFCCLLLVAVAPRPLDATARAKEDLKRFLQIDVKREQKLKERSKKDEEAEEKKEEQKQEEIPKEEEETPTVEQKVQPMGDPLKKQIDMKKEEFKPLKEGHIGKDAKRDSDMAKEMKKKGVIAVLDSKMKKNTSLTKLLGKDRSLAVKNAMLIDENGDYSLEDDSDTDLSYMGDGSTGDFGGGGGFGGAGGYGGGGGGFGGGGAFGMGGMGGLGGMGGGIGGMDAEAAGRQALAGMKGKDRVRASKMNLGSGSMGEFCKKADVQRKVKGRAAAIRACYEMQLQMKPDLAGKVTVQWIIDLTGMVKGAKAAENTTGNSALGTCIEKIIGKIHFEPPTGGMCIIRWPFVFSPGE